MRRILVERARRKRRIKHGAGLQRIDADEVEIALPDDSVDILELDAALDRLKENDPEAARLVELRYFAGLTLRECAEILGKSPRAVDRIWAYSKAWIRRQMEHEAGLR